MTLGGDGATATIVTKKTDGSPFPLTARAFLRALELGARVLCATFAAVQGR